MGDNAGECRFKVKKCNVVVSAGKGRAIKGSMFKSIVTAAKFTLVFLNIWVLAVVLVITLGHWRVFESSDPAIKYSSHLVVMRELKEEGTRKNGFQTSNSSLGHNANTIRDLSAANHHHPSDTSSSVSASSSPPSESQLVHDKRVANLRHWCKQQHPHAKSPENIPRQKLGSILVDERHKLLFCQIPGVAINEWRKLMLILSGVVNASYTAAISGGDVYGKYAKLPKRLSEYGDNARAEMLKTFFKVVFVREPLERLVIAYRNKLLSKSSKYFHKAFGSPIIRKYRKNASESQISAGTDVRFSEFVRFIIDNEHEGVQALNEHWEQYYKQCHPCLIDFDFVGTFENAEEDTRAVLEKLNVTRSIKPPYVLDKRILSQEELSNIYSEITAKELNNLFKAYSADYTLFGYQCPAFVHDIFDKGNIFHDY